MEPLTQPCPDTGIIIHSNGAIIDVNQQLLSMTAYPREEIIGKQVLELFAPESHSITRNTLMRKNRGRIKVYGLKKCGATFLAELFPSDSFSSDTCPEINTISSSPGTTGLQETLYLRNISLEHSQPDNHPFRIDDLISIISNMQDTFYRTNTAGEIIWVSPSVSELLGYSPCSLIGKSLSDFYYEPDGRKKFLSLLNSSSGSVSNYEAPLRHKDGSVVWVSTNAHYYHDAAGKELGIEGTTRNITTLVKTRSALTHERERALVTLASIADGVITTDNQQIIEYLNPAAVKLCGWSLEEARGLPLNTVFQLQNEKTSQDFTCSLETCCSAMAATVIPSHLTLTRRDGTVLSLQHSATPIRDTQGNQVGIVVVFRDVSELRQMEDKLSHQASHDSLTSLINRYEFECQLNDILEDARQHDHQHALCYLDLDQFKIVNDTCGHIAGDQLLKQLTGRLRAHVRNNDILARLGGDEFGILLENITVEHAHKIADDIRQVVRDFRFSWDNKLFEIGVSIGLTPITAYSGTITDVLSAADSACYVAKDLGGNRIHIYQHDDLALNQRSGEMQWVQQIKRALQEGRLTLHIQATRPLHENSPQYKELLLRMISDSGELIAPNTFIAAAERYHLMPEIDEWVIQHALKLLAEMPRPLDASQEIFAINLSGQSICDNNFHDYVISQIQDSGIPAQCICFEITETSAITNLAHAIQFITTIKAMGCHFALDDFGSGLSSFGYLKNLPVDYLKIDGSFIKNMATDPIDCAMVRTINEIGHLMGKATIAECVEDAESEKLLQEIGVDYIQGFHIEKPATIQ